MKTWSIVSAVRDTFLWVHVGYILVKSENEKYLSDRYFKYETYT